MNPNAAAMTALSPQQAQAMAPQMQPQQPFQGILAGPGTLDQRLMTLNQSPMFNIGMGLLASGYDPRINPFQAAMGGLQTAQAYKTQSEKREEEKEDRATLQDQREMLENFFKAQEEQLNRLRAFRGLPPRGQTAYDQVVSPSVQRGLGANAMMGSDDPITRANQDLYRRMALQEIMGY